MEDKKLSELQHVGKEWFAATAKAFRHIDKELGVKGRIAVIFAIIIVWMLGGILAHMNGRYEGRFNDRGNMMGDRGNMIQGREDIMQGRGKMMQDRGNIMQGMQGCTQHATVAIDPQNPNAAIVRSESTCPFADQENGRNQKIDNESSMFDRMESRMKSFFGADSKGNLATGSVQ